MQNSKIYFLNAPEHVNDLKNNLFAIASEKNDKRRPKDFQFSDDDKLSVHGAKYVRIVPINEIKVFKYIIKLFITSCAI